MVFTVVAKLCSIYHRSTVFLLLEKAAMTCALCCFVILFGVWDGGQVMAI